MRWLLVLALCGCGGDEAGLSFDASGCPIMDGRAAKVAWKFPIGTVADEVRGASGRLRFTARAGGFLLEDENGRQGMARIHDICGLTIESLDIEGPPWPLEAYWSPLDRVWRGWARSPAGPDWEWYAVIKPE